MNLRAIIIFVFIFFSNPLIAEPIILFEGVHTVPTFPYKQILQGVTVPDFGKDWAKNKAREVDNSNDPTNPSNWLPVTTLKLTPGAVSAREVSFNDLASPVCIVGSDERSLNWIRKYQSVLLENNVLCWLVSADNVGDVRKVVKALAGVSMSPANGDAIAEFFSIRHYPVLITQRLIEQ